MYTVYIKTLSNARINVDHINKIWGELNQIMVVTSDSSVETIYCGNTDHVDRKIETILSLIDEAKRKSENIGDLLILDFSKFIN
ncbi:hypothetical protein MettiDRAFT_1607 [Methanolobus tindarius DSM 2278]|uniref:Uncharacterized protein n=1 Tax=Methanolobus tindarius DSM 2278 TaxID=1090322 RepID=W9DPE1_METTI|nr:hypothetical protein [Methanolobus tindarius]ETA68154.1 hypothetical protein MettiDRAFT_1607 [Methanolobus tindarius DSM 2278]